MLSRGIILLVIAPLLVAITPSVPLKSNEDDIVTQCEIKTQQFTNNEEKYIDRSFHDQTKEPDLPGPQVKELQERAYSIEVDQRPFECISNCTDELTKVSMALNPKYIALVAKCKMGQPQPHCVNSSSKYRSMDGTCNNILFPKRGSIFSCYRRFLPQRFEGVSGFRKSVCGKSLPDPRTVSLKINQDRTTPNNNVTHMFTLFGQFIAHDLADTPVTFIHTQVIDCCSPPAKDEHPQCAPILISKDDPFYSKFGYTCINVARASICNSCNIGKRNQMNQATAYIDLSCVYGPTENTSKELRAYDGTGKLKCNYANGEELLPSDYNLTICGDRNKTQFCFKAGDHRANQHSVLMGLQTMFLREHNRIAKELCKINPHWDEEKLFQESRKINIAQMQAIVYRDYLPILIGPELMTLYGLCDNDTIRSVYDPSADATLWAEFSGAAYRLHGTINGEVSKFHCQHFDQRLKFQFANSVPLYSGKMSSLMEDVSLSPAVKYNRFMSGDLTEHVYRPPKGDYGLDLAAVHVQRGRDFGLPTYTEMVSYFTIGLKNIQTFEDLEYCMEKENIEALRRIYCDVKDIDLWIGLISEKVEENMVVGPIAAKIIATQFSVLKRGDRFYYEHPLNFNDEQWKNLRNSSLSSVMCANLKIQHMQKNAFKFADCDNPIMRCKDIPKLDLTLWKE